MDLLQQTDALLRGVIIAVVYFSPLSDLYKPRDRGDVRSAQRLLRYLILAQIPLLLVGFGAGLLTQLHNPDVAAINEHLEYGRPASALLARGIAGRLSDRQCLPVLVLERCSDRLFDRDRGGDPRDALSGSLDHGRRGWGCSRPASPS